MNDVWLFCISGFTQQSTRRNGNGMLDLFLKLSRFRSPRTSVAIREWHHDWKAQAEQVRIYSDWPHPTVAIFAYSWGAGWGAVQLARHLQERGIEVDSLVLSDPVYRHPLWSLSWLSLLSNRTITIPSNVRQVWHYYQRENKPSGHRIDRESSKTLIHWSRQVHGIPHQEMDGYSKFHEVCIEQAADLSK